MTDLSTRDDHFLYAADFRQLVSTPFRGQHNAICWKRRLSGDFAEIVRKIPLEENIIEVDENDLKELQLTEKGEHARKIILNDLNLLKDHGASPVLNLIRHYHRDTSCPFFPTDVYSWHKDRSPVPTDTFLCTYYGAPSDILPNSDATPKVLVPGIRAQLKTLHSGTEEDFDFFLREHFFDLHYVANPVAHPVSLGVGHLWRLAVEHPGSEVPPSIHRAPVEKPGELRLMLIC